MNLNKLKEEQTKLARKVVTTNDFDEVKFVAGCDQTFVDDKIISSIVVLDYETMEVVEKAHAVVESKLPYIPGFLSYRETPAVVEAFQKLNTRPDILIVDGNGILHPRRIGIASHIGIVLDVPTIGVAKNLLVGEEKDGKIYVKDEARAIPVRTKEHARPVYVSPGHRVSLKTCVDVVNKTLIHPHKLPEPIHLAHRHAKKVKEEFK